MWNERALPKKAVQVPFGTVLRASLLPIAVWAGTACFLWFAFAPLAAAVLGALFLALCVVGFVVRRRKGHSVRCSVWGAFGGVLDKSVAGL
ncbi:hypothetical protein OG897_05515 [Streptomyces sp. NBC_00237]|uniref:hypothetical protein n=1 Tax=Streptomyces sp. NBC_00237 TaxID=2975687 RepID=UPI002255D4CB|nr:hypothetical protein [Streptomyces sp. NBC_00237]MCX5200921.1 hypothetical protein [Streptomyces sp. NBC_00237]